MSDDSPDVPMSDLPTPKDVLSGKKRKHEESSDDDESESSSMVDSLDDESESDDSIVDNSPIKIPSPLNEAEEIELAMKEGKTFAEGVEGIEKNGRILRKPRAKKEDPFKIEVARVQLLDQIKLIHKELKALQKESPELNITLPKMPPFKTPYQEVIELHTKFEELYTNIMKEIGEEDEEDEEEEEEDDEDTSSFCSSDEEEDSDEDSEDSDESEED